MSTDHC